LVAGTDCAFAQGAKKLSKQTLEKKHLVNVCTDPGIS
jgi:hypothetical protein